ncbi:hypothetical protein IAR55_000877 [Kwoniella newhampshirensis]|uniref:Uncharacterized protein n=1 Tax=Kwoniella newhampshirensis TaxID=1651941 RepID=A0AAW0Z4X6_9TREE
MVDPRMSTHPRMLGPGMMTVMNGRPLLPAMSQFRAAAPGNYMPIVPPSMRGQDMAEGMYGRPPSSMNQFSPPSAGLDRTAITSSIGRATVPVTSVNVSSNASTTGDVYQYIDLSTIQPKFTSEGPPGTNLIAMSLTVPREVYTKEEINMYTDAEWAQRDPTRRSRQ